tara:strand:- start:139 stop:435 length:297 start_codon:yes stop_codon:yes gene_type:complete
MNIKVGSRLKCSLTGSEFMVVKIGDGALSNGGKILIDSKENSEISSENNIEGSGNTLGKRYESKSGIIVLCTKAGQGIISCDNTPMTEVKPKRLPSSD